MSPGHALVVPARHCLIPRYAGDHPAPRGGVRQIIPWKADYPREAGVSR